MSNDTAECGCEGHVENFDACKYPALLAENERLKAAVHELASDALRHVPSCDWGGTVRGECSKHPDRSPCTFCVESARLRALKEDT